MAGRGRASFQKKQKEQLRQERKQQKAARLQERKAMKAAGIEPPPDDELDLELENDEPLSEAELQRIISR